MLYFLRLTIIIVLVYPPFVLYAQDESLKQKIIEDQAIKLIREYESTLNLIIQVDSELEKDLIIKNSYSRNNGNQIFVNKNVIIESDLDPESNLSKQTIDMNVPTYLNKFWLLFQKDKNTDHPVEFENIKVDTIYQNNELAEVTFDCIFHGKHSYRAMNYGKNSRKATIQINKTDRWYLRIAGISFNQKTFTENVKINQAIPQDSLRYVKPVKTINRKTFTSKERDIAVVTGIFIVAITIFILKQGN